MNRMIYHLLESESLKPVAASASPAALFPHAAHIVVAVVRASLSALRPEVNINQDCAAGKVLLPAPLVQKSHERVNSCRDEALSLLHLLHRLLDLPQRVLIALRLRLCD